jgi:hypothetical protein
MLRIAQPFRHGWEVPRHLASPLSRCGCDETGSGLTPVCQDDPARSLNHIINIINIITTTLHCFSPQHRSC